MSHDSEDLTIRQEKAIAALLSCRTVAEAAKLAQVGERSIYRWLKQDTFSPTSVAPAARPSHRLWDACSRSPIAP